MKIFWSWQSDHDGKISRYFIRDALREAVKQLKDDPDITVPTEREARSALHVDQDRQDVPGSPNLADTILEKINAALVVVADVTPVVRGKATSENPRGRAVMNPNVAIELGYALGRLDTGRVLMILNEHFGDRSDLPFDLRHKGGPILYELSPDASSDARAREQRRLTTELVMALKPYLKLPHLAEQKIPSFNRAATGFNCGVWFGEDEPLLATRSIQGDRNLSMRPTPVMYLRLFPTKPISRELAKSDARAIVSQIPLLSGTLGGWNDANKYGAIQAAGETAENEVGVATQLFYSGEAWFSNNHLMEQITRSGFINIPKLESFLISRLPYLIKQFVSVVATGLPVDLEFGFVGITGLRFDIDTFHTNFGTIIEDPKPISLRVEGISDNSLNDLLLEIFRGIFWNLVREHRPECLNGFPTKKA